MNTSSSKPEAGAQPAAHHDLQYREYKLLLRADRFAHPQQFHKFWKITRRVAKSLGIEIRKRGQPMETHRREVIFFDTPRFRLYNHGFILRRRTFYHHGLPAPEFELTLKFRSANLDEVAAVDVRPVLSSQHEVKLKEEILMPRDRIGGMRSIYSHGCELGTPDAKIMESFETISQVFPALLPTGAKAGTALSVVNGIAIEEVLVNLGEIDFGGKITAKATLAIWRDRATHREFAGEYGYQVKFHSPEDFHGKPRGLSDAFYLELQRAADEWLQIGTTKTEMIYRAGKISVVNHE